MSWEAEWAIKKVPERAELAAHLQAIAAAAQIPAPAVSVSEDGIVGITFTVAVAGAERIPARIGSTMSEEDVRDELDPPDGDVDWEGAEAAGFVEVNGAMKSLLPGGEKFDRVPQSYTLRIEVIPGEDNDGEPIPPRVSVYSNVDDNRAGWPVAQELGLALAERLGRAEEDEHHGEYLN